MSASASGQKTEASRFGDDLAVWTRGWSHGIEVLARLDEDGREIFEIWKTGGSGSKSNGQKLLATLVDGKIDKIVIGPNPIF